ncbi:hypothetical protein SAMN04244572_04824 [Azotobacter beijerinckii]|uniref:Uncharacterized protein n=1 Tax=Azotobacter beijerinckii TaxID=170623 RepID=A0A1H7AL32_9GAMM|nr:hypothetical protein [Azotobacter beijerinckii]SEJ66078.1 hypothetical protein SAMN04244572_04824 [Azotobacter beijerinckii]
MSRPKEHGTVENYRLLDINALNRHGLLAPGRSFAWQWGTDANISIHMEGAERLRLSYRVAGEPREYRAAIEWTPCHLGGERPWFRCPACGRRMAKLSIGEVTACRRCLGLNYAAQQASKGDRPHNRHWKLRRALGCHELIPVDLIPKPKSMHWRTFARKIEQLREAERQAFAATAAQLERLRRC